MFNFSFLAIVISEILDTNIVYFILSNCIFNCNKSCLQCIFCVSEVLQLGLLDLKYKVCILTYVVAACSWLLRRPAHTEDIWRLLRCLHSWRLVQWSAARIRRVPTARRRRILLTPYSECQLFVRIRNTENERVVASLTVWCFPYKFYTENDQQSLGRVETWGPEQHQASRLFYYRPEQCWGRDEALGLTVVQYNDQNYLTVGRSL